MVSGEMVNHLPIKTGQEFWKSLNSSLLPPTLTYSRKCLSHVHFPCRHMEEGGEGLRMARSAYVIPSPAMKKKTACKGMCPLVFYSRAFPKSRGRHRN